MKTFSLFLTWSCLLLLTASLPAASLCFIPRDPSGDSPAWKFEFGVAFITTNNIEDIPSGNIDIADGSAGGEIYVLTASKQLGEFEFNVGGCSFHPQLELPLTLEIVNESGRDPFLDYNAALMLRWVDFPWNKYVKTSFSMGLGLSYSSKIYQVDKDRHPDDDRSHLKFNWPIQMSLALPNHPDHELLLFILHQSGGHVFDDGGVNSVGFGYRTSF
jgi:hypothetical protein